MNSIVLRPDELEEKQAGSGTRGRIWEMISEMQRCSDHHWQDFQSLANYVQSYRVFPSTVEFGEDGVGDFHSAAS